MRKLKRLAGIFLTMFPAACGALEGDEGWNESTSQSLTAAPTFDWSVPDRLKIDERDGISWTASPYVDKDGLTHPIEEVSPNKFTVNFDACGNGSDTVSYEWRVEGDQALKRTADCKGFSYEFSSEGLFQVSLTTIDSRGATATATRDVTVQDWLLVGLGDSYGSGEGNPDIPIPESSIEAWLKAHAEFAQASLDLSDASRVLGLIQEVSGPLDYLRDKIREHSDALLDIPGRCANIFNPLGCLDAQAHAVQAGRRMFEAAGELIFALAPRALELGVELTLDPRSLLDKLDQLKATAEATWNLANQVLIENTPAKLLVDIFDGSKGARWQDRQCHRSQFSSQAQAAFALERSDPKTSVTFINLACSGASTREGLLGSYFGQESKDFYALPPQVDVAARLAGGREVDAVLLSVGGNDVGFGEIIPACIGQEPCDSTGSVERGLGESTLATALCAGVNLFSDSCTDFFKSTNAAGQRTAREIFESARPTLRDNYSEISSALDAVFPAVFRESNRVYITEYPDTSQTETGSLCSHRVDRADPFMNLPGMSAREWGWAGTSLTRFGLNVEIAAAAINNDWTYVGGIFGDYAKHGYCSDENWFVRIQESFLRQGNQSGTLHPNLNGQLATARRINEALSVDLYAANAGLPRVPQVPPLAIAAGPLVTDEGTIVPFQNNSIDPARTGNLTFAWALTHTRPGAASLSSISARQPSLFANDDTAGVAHLTVSNLFGTSTAYVGFIVRNVPPTVALGADRNVQFGQTLVFEGTFADQGVLDTHVASIDWGDGTGIQPVAASNGRVSASHTFRKLGPTTVKLVVRDDDGGEGTDTVVINVVNTPPKLVPIVGPSDQVLPGEPLSLAASVIDYGDTNTGFWIWDDGTTSPADMRPEVFGSTATGTHQYEASGVYSVTLVVTDSAGASASAAFLFLIVVDPQAGAFQARGQVLAPVGSFGLDPSFSGEIDVSVRARYQGDKVTPSGRVNFRRGPQLVFKANFLEWLVVKGNRAQIFGFGSLNGVPEYDFFATGVDAETGGGVDGFRIKIWESWSQRVVYDNAPGQSDDLDVVVVPGILSGDVVIGKQ